MHIPVPDNGIPVKLGDTSFIYKDVYHPIVWIGNIPYRPRVETLIIKDGTLVYLHLKKDKGSSGVKGCYELPGGSIDADCSKIEQARNEVNEESLMSISDIYDTGIQYYESYPEGFLMNGGDTPLEYKGHISDVFVAKYNGLYDRRGVAAKDLDPKIAENGAFYRITEVATLLKDQHVTAILNSPYVKDSTKGALRILNQMNTSGILQDVKSINSNEIVDTLVFVSSDGNLTHVAGEPIRGNKDGLRKVSMFHSIKHAVEFVNIERTNLSSGNVKLKHAIMYVYMIDNPSAELMLYTPSNDESPASKVMGELWIKTKTDLRVKRLGMIRVTTDGDVSYFYGGPRNMHKYQVTKCDFKWIMKDCVSIPAMETTSNVIVPGDKLYHGTTYEISKFEPMSLNLGNAMEEPGWCTFAFADYTLALRFGFMRAIQKVGDYWRKKITCSWDLSESKPYISSSDYNKIKDAIQGFRFFVYTIDATNLNVGLGNDDRLSEYTFSESGVVPEKEDIHRIDNAMVREHLTIIPDNEFSEFVKTQKTMAKYGHPRGWYGAIMTKDYNNGDASHQLQKACSNGDLKPGDDIQEYMNTHGISFDEDSISYSDTVTESSYYRVTCDGVGIYDAVKLSVDQQTWINILNDDRVTWLQKPPSYVASNRSYFTKAGYDMFTRKTLPLIKDYVRPEKIQVSTKSNIGNVVYSDKYQVIVNESAFPVFESSEIIGSHNMYFLSDINMDAKTIQPRIPNNFLTSNGYEDTKTKRICFATSIDKALMGLSQNLKGKEFFVHVPAKGINRACVIHPSSQQVPDVTVTGEIWYTLPVQLKCVGKIVVTGDDGQPGKHYNYGNHIAELYGWDWEWVDESISPTTESSSYYRVTYDTKSTMYNDTPMKSIMDKNFRKQPQRKLSSFKKLKINQSVVNKYKNKTNALRNMGPNEEGYVFVDGEKFVAVVVVDTGRDATGDLKDYNWITYIEVEDKYKGCGLSRQLLDIAVKELKGDFLTVTYDNEVAINLYKSYGFKISKYSYDEVKSGKSKSHMYTMFYKDHHPKGVEFVNESAFPVTESLFISKGVFDVNFEDFESGKSNVVLVTGLSGSGKTTLGTKIANKYNAELIELDCFECCYQFENDEQLRQAGEVFYQYLSSHKTLWDKLKQRSIKGTELAEEIDKFIKYVISWCKKDKSTKYVIEGVQIYSLLNKEKISGVSLLIVGTSALKSLVRRLDRTRKNNKEDLKNELSELPQCIAWYIDENKQFEKFKKSVLESTSIEESPVFEVAEYSSTNRYPVFITLMHTGTPTATFIKKMTGDEFSHATIAFNVRLSPQYSFGTKKLGGKERGLVIHGTRDPFYDQFKTTYATYVMYVSKEQREKMLTRLQWFVDHEETLKYDTLALGACFFHIPTEFRKKYFCSRFVMEIIGEGQKLSKVPSLWKPQEIASLNNISLVNAGDDFRHYDYRVTSANLNLIKEKRQNEIHVEVPVSESTRSELPNSVFGLPKYRKYPLDTEEHVKSAVKFFNYISPENEEELAKNILERINDLGMEPPAVTERNRFIKYLSESIELDNGKQPNWSLINILPAEERQKALKAIAPFANKPVVYKNSVYVGNEPTGVINAFEDEVDNTHLRVFIIIHPDFVGFKELSETLIHEMQLELTHPRCAYQYIWTNYTNQPDAWWLILDQDTAAIDAAKPDKLFNEFGNIEGQNEFVAESCKNEKQARKFVSDVRKLAEKYDANFFVVTDGASGYHNKNNENPAVKTARENHTIWERRHEFDPDEDWVKDSMSETHYGDIFESGRFKDYIQYADFDSAMGPVSETWIPLMEAPKAIDKDKTGETPDDYTEDIEEPDDNLETGVPDDTEQEEASDYTDDVEDTPDDEQEDDTQTEDSQNDNPEGADDNFEEEPTDYTSDAESGEEGTEDSSDNDDDSGSESFDSSDSSDSDTENKNGNLFNNNVLKNYSLLKNFEKLYELTKEVSDSLDSKVEPTKLQNDVLAQVLKNLGTIKEFILSYVKFQFSEDNYSQNLYYYNIILQALKLNLELLKRNSKLEKKENK